MLCFVKVVFQNLGQTIAVDIVIDICTDNLQCLLCDFYAESLDSEEIHNDSTDNLRVVFQNIYCSDIDIQLHSFKHTLPSIYAADCAYLLDFKGSHAITIKSLSIINLSL